MPDPENRQTPTKKRGHEELNVHAADKPFSQRVTAPGTFFTDTQTYGLDIEMPNKPPTKHSPLMTHDAPFKPSNPAKKGYNKTLNKFPEYKEDPIRRTERKRQKEEDAAKWKATYRRKGVPCPSVTTNYKNLKSEFPSVFRRF